MKKTKILVIARKHIPEFLLINGFSPAPKPIINSVIESPHLHFMDRDEAENNPEFKQLIPYVVFKSPNGIFNYQRGKASSESRLRSLRSLGIGGHIEEEDGNTGKASYLKGLWRELEEEVGIKHSPENIKLLGVINDDTNEVGKVHLGIVHLFNIESSNLESKELNLIDCKFSNIEELNDSKDLFETWSSLLIPHITK